MSPKRLKRLNIKFLRFKISFIDINTDCYSGIDFALLLIDGWPLEGKDKRCTDYEYLKSAVNGQIQCQIKCLYHKEFGCVGILYSYKKDFTLFCALCKDDVLTDATNEFGFYRNVESK